MATPPAVAAICPISDGWAGAATAGAATADGGGAARAGTEAAGCGAGE